MRIKNSRREDKLGRTAQLHLRVTPELREALRKIWNYKEFPQCAMTYPDPRNPRVQRAFASEAEFIEWGLENIIELSKNKIAWQNFAETLVQ